MDQDDAGQPAPVRRGRVRPAALAAVGIVGAAGLAVWALTGSGPAPARTPAAVPNLSAAPSPAASLSPSPAPSPPPGAEPTAPPATDPAPALSTPAATVQATTAAKSAAPTRRATTKPRSEITPGTDNCHCDHHPAPVDPNCQRDAAGTVMTCDPVRTLTPPPDPAASPKQ
ncbi:hypothetical protein [Kitasatospora sp. MBT63]|uniref:hypothetical protein n=1 Tax=Kitasatospora sp. MBT63 TaxID=1444768 RepID=UPI00053B32ED|nr:hypothetical protein [Kitasatospora sp. MBT63]